MTPKFNNLVSALLEADASKKKTTRKKKSNSHKFDSRSGKYYKPKAVSEKANIDRLVETTITGPTAGEGPGTTGRAQYLKVLDKVMDRGSKINPDHRNMPRVWNVEPGIELPNKQVFIVDNKLGVQVTFRPAGRSRSGRIIGTWKVDRVWRQN